MDLCGLKDFLEAKGDGGLGHLLRVAAKEACVLRPRGRRELNHPATHLSAAGGFVEPHVAIAAQSQQLHPHTTRSGQALLVGLCRSLRVSSSRLRQTELLRA